eukprot:Nk52_evm41s1524 gene=Nk52_evmTU41s1524
MENFGTLRPSYLDGYSGEKICPLSKDTIAYIREGLVVFLNTETKSQTLGYFNVYDLTALSCHPSTQRFAVSENGASATVKVLQYPGMNTLAELEDASETECIGTCFSRDGSYVGILGGTPHFNICLWDWSSNSLIAQVKDSYCYTSISFNPVSNKDLCLSGNGKVSFWKLEKFNDSSTFSEAAVDLSKVEPKRFHEYGEIENGSVFKPDCHVWDADNHVYVGCLGGEILRVDCNSSVVKEVIREVQKSDASNTSDISDNPQEQEEGDDGDENNDKEKKKKKDAEEEEEKEVTRDVNARLSEGMVHTLALTRTHLIAGGLDGRLRFFSTAANYMLDSEFECFDSISNIAFCPDYKHLIIGSKDGNMSQLSIDHLGMEKLLSCCIGSFTGISPLSGLFVAAASTDGYLKIINFVNGSQVAKYDTGSPLATIECSSVGNLIATGSKEGVFSLYIFNGEGPSVKLLAQYKLFNEPVHTIHFDLVQDLVICTCKNGTVYIISINPKRIVGNFSVNGTIEGISVCDPGLPENASCEVCIVFHEAGKSYFSRNTIPKPLDLNACDDNMGNDDDVYELPKTVIMSVLWGLECPSYGCVLNPSNRSAVYCLSGEGSLVMHQLSISAGIELKEDECLKSTMSVVENKCNHEGSIYLKSVANSQRMISYGNEGDIVIRTVAEPHSSYKMVCHLMSRSHKGINTANASFDGQFFFTGSADGSFCVWKFQFSDYGHSLTSQLASEIDSYTSELKNEKAELLQSLSALPPALPIANPKTCQTAAEDKADENKQQSDHSFDEYKDTLKAKLRDLRTIILAKIVANDEADELQKLDRQEFTLDKELRSQLIAEGDAQVAALQEKNEFENLERQYRKDMIKSMCWEAMKVKGKILLAIEDKTEVSNYPLRNMTEEEILEIERAKTLRKIEIAEQQARNSLEVLDRQVDVENTGEDNEEQEEDQDEEDGLLYSPFALYTTQRKRTQIVLLQTHIQTLKEEFNKEFEIVFGLKENEIMKIEEKNTRIKEICSELGIEEDIFHPTFSDYEKPERLFEVQDSEVGIEKYISPETAKRLEEEARIAAEKRAADQADNVEARALEMMMGGRLEAATEDELMKEPERPEWMNAPAEELTEDEQKQVKEFEKKYNMFLEEREKRRKALETELKKVQESIQQTYQGFNERLGELFHLKIETEQKIIMTELKVLKLIKSLQDEEDVYNEENKLAELLESKQYEKVKSASLLSDLQRASEGLKEQLELLNQEDKALDRQFKRDFADQEAFFDILTKLFKRRPKQTKNSQIRTSTLDTSGDPMGFVESAIATNTLEESINMVDSAADMPEGIDASVWDKFLDARNDKIKFEFDLKKKQAEYQEICTYINRHEIEDDTLREEIDQAMKRLTDLKEKKLEATLDLEIQIQVKQGQVELPNVSNCLEHEDAVLIHRSLVEELNEQITAAGRIKVESLKEIKDYRKGIHFLEWENQRLDMEAEDLVTKARDVQMLRVTKNLQEIIKGGDKKTQASETAALEKRLELNNLHHSNNIEEKKKMIEKIHKQQKDKEHENLRIAKIVEGLDLEVYDRHITIETLEANSTQKGPEQRLREITERSRLVDIAKSQAEEISVLREEVERLRMKTFPSFSGNA